MLHGCNCLFHASGGSPSAECASVVCTRSLETTPGSRYETSKHDDYSMGALAPQTLCPSCEYPNKEPELKPVPDETVTLPGGLKMDVYSIDVPHRQLVCAKCSKPLLFSNGRLHCGCNSQSTVG